MNYNAIRLPNPYSDNYIICVGSELESRLRKDVFLIVLFQYNNQEEYVNTNIHFQWRYRPASDVFFVFNSSNGKEHSYEFQDYLVALKILYWI